jgi:hypothetical protein
MDALKAFFRGSVTILWARIVALVGAVLASLSAAADQLPDVAASLQAAGVERILDPKLTPYYLVGIGIITELARRRTAGK